MLLTLSFCCHSVVSDSATPWTTACQASLSFTISQSVLKLMSIESVMPSNHLILCHPRLLLPSVFPSIRVFSSESALPIRWPKYWSFSFSVNPSSEHPGLISFRMDQLDLLAVPGTLKSLLQHHSVKALCRNILFSQRDPLSKCQGLPQALIPLISYSGITGAEAQLHVSHEVPSRPVLEHIPQSTHCGAGFTDIFLLSHFHR